MMITTRLLLAVGIAVAGLMGAASPASAQEPAWIRLAHLSPTTPPMDVYVAPAAGGEESVVLPHIGYGAVSGYVDLPPGTYVFPWRAAGSPATDPGLLTLSAELEAGAAYTVAGVGQGGEVRSVLINDDLTPPAQDEVRVRFINADSSSGPVDLALVGGPVLVDDADFATVTEYGSIPSGTQTIEVVTAEAPEGAEMTVDLAAGSVNTLLLLQTDSPVGDLSAVLDAPGMSMISETSVMSSLQDAVGSSAMPAVGAVQAGAGGTAAEPTTSFVPLAGLAALAAAAAGGFALKLRRASCQRWS